MTSIYAPLTDAKPFTSVELSSIVGSYTLKSTTATGSIRFQTGTTTSATGFVVQDSTGVAAPIMSITGDGTVNIPSNRFIQRSAGYAVPCFATGDAFQALTGTGDITVTSSYTRWTTTGANIATLANPTTLGVPDGFIKTIQMVVDGGDGTLNVLGMIAGNDQWVFSEVGHSITVMAITVPPNDGWVLLHDGMGDTTVGSMPAFS